MKATALALSILALLPAGAAADLPADLVGLPSETLPVVEEVELLQLTPKMAKFLLEHVPADQGRRIRLRALTQAIFSKDGLDIKYGNIRTKTAAETFHSRSGNCLSFTILFVAMARHLGLNAYFEEVAEVTSWDMRGEIVLSNQHMFAEVELDNGIVRVDFLPGTEKRYQVIHRITDTRAAAHYYNNLGAEALAEGDGLLARAYFERSLAKDPTFTPAWNNLGFAFRQQGDFARAERSYLKALEIERSELAAATNLAGLYLAEGRRADAEPLLQRVRDRQLQNPFYHFRLGMRAAQGGDLEGAIPHLKEAVRRQPKDLDLILSLAEVYVRSGEVVKAKESLTRAIELATDREQSRALQRRLETLRLQTQ